MLSKPAVVILNPLSGSGRHQPTIRRAAQAWQIDVRELRTGHRAEALARDAVHAGAQVLVAAGGDGTVSAVAGVAVEYDVSLVVVPCGTRNHFAKTAGQTSLIRRASWPRLRTVPRDGSMSGR
jgi:diacylglycerol kinase family enzyme